MSAHSNDAKEIIERQKIEFNRIQIERHPAFVKIGRNEAEKELTQRLAKGAKYAWFLRPSESYEDCYVLCFIGFCGYNKPDKRLINLYPEGYQWVKHPDEDRIEDRCKDKLEDFINFTIDGDVSYAKVRTLIRCIPKLRSKTRYLSWYNLRITWPESEPSEKNDSPPLPVPKKENEGSLQLDIESFLQDLIFMAPKLYLPKEFVQSFVTKAFDLKKTIRVEKEEDTETSAFIDFGEAFFLQLAQIMDNYCELMLEYIHDHIKEKTCNGVSQLILSYYDEYRLCAHNVETNLFEFSETGHPIVKSTELIFSHFQSKQAPQLQQHNQGQQQEQAQQQEQEQQQIVPTKSVLLPNIDLNDPNFEIFRHHAICGGR